MVKFVILDKNGQALDIIFKDPCRLASARSRNDASACILIDIIEGSTVQYELLFPQQ